MDDELERPKAVEGSGHDLIESISGHYFLKELRKMEMNFSQDNWCPGLRFEHVTSQIRSASANHQPQCSVRLVMNAELYEMVVTIPVLVFRIYVTAVK
jgi:hypothetical protein